MQVGGFRRYFLSLLSHAHMYWQAWNSSETGSEQETCQGIGGYMSVGKLNMDGL